MAHRIESSLKILRFTGLWSVCFLISAVASEIGKSVKENPEDTEGDDYVTLDSDNGSKQNTT